MIESSLFLWGNKTPNKSARKMKMIMTYLDGSSSILHFLGSFFFPFCWTSSVFHMCFHHVPCSSSLYVVKRCLTQFITCHFMSCDFFIKAEPCNQFYLCFSCYMFRKNKAHEADDASAYLMNDFTMIWSAWLLYLCFGLYTVEFHWFPRKPERQTDTDGPTDRLSLS